MEATAGAAPASGAGAESGNRASHNSVPSTGNSAGEKSPSQHQAQGARQPSSAQKSPPRQESRQESDDHDETERSPPRKAAKSAADDDDPEFDFGDRGKFKRSQVVNDFKALSKQASSLAKARNEAEQRAKKAEALAKHLQNIGVDLETFEKDPQAAFQQAAYAQMQRQLDEATLPPEEIERRKLVAERDEHAKKLQAYQEREQQQQEAAAVESRAQEFSHEIRQALDQAGASIPRNAKTIALMAQMMLAAGRSGQKLLPHEIAQRAIQITLEERDHHLSSFRNESGKVDAKALINWIGPEFKEAIRAELLAEADSKFPRNPQQRRPSEPKIFSSSSHPNGYHTLDEYNEAQLRRAKR